MFDIEENLKNLPMQPGVYLMKDMYDNIIYVGKAIKLRNRVRQYFRKSTNHSNKIRKMVTMIKSFEYIVTDSELEALILECNLIKKHRPKYNTLLKDDKAYPYIKVTVDEMYPRIIYSRELKKDKAKYFGPYTNATGAKETIEVITKIWKIRTCNRRLPKDIGKERPCLNYHIKQCHGPCQGYISREDYGAHIHEIIEFLGGKYDKVIGILEEKMKQASEDMDFEKAAEYRDQLMSVKSIAGKQKIINASMEDQDVIAFAKSQDEALVQVYFIRHGKLIGREHFHLDGVEDLHRQEVMTTFVKQFYSGTPYIPKEIILQEEIDEANIINAWLDNKRGQKVYIKVPRKGEKHKLVELAAQNALLTFQQFGERMKREDRRTKGAVQELIDLICLDDDVTRIEAYDISNIHGFEAVGSMVVFEEGKPKRSDYRKFRIKSVKGPNDYKSMEEVLTRRFTHALEEQKEMLLKKQDVSLGKFTRLPDLILMDGGKGQVNIALKVLDTLGLRIPVCGMVKDDKHRTRGLYYQNVEFNMDTHSEGFKLMTRIQDEAHRFAIEYHRKLRSKQQIQSILDDIEGIGPKRRVTLIKHFGSVEKIRQAELSDLEAVVGISQRVANTVYHFFRDEDKSSSKANKD
ncbi:excinuclease ABC subunit UvrC [Vallitalea pronyensis]|uniref:UvrABC system protein C n=1 Tax=Vallitalea pronyensis TaxID=1348613 RepID=A0A8J8SIL5_9FIRM|nr:excinuclease ABC subunit UvrC [Vallitalea pronyensis]QUI25060.1 excinuclease ABC subunit UvrC [Vallitalea pronyensis]